MAFHATRSRLATGGRMSNQFGQFYAEEASKSGGRIVRAVALLEDIRDKHENPEHVAEIQEVIDVLNGK